MTSFKSISLFLLSLSYFNFLPPHGYYLCSAILTFFKFDPSNFFNFRQANAFVKV
ncbi:hypothetical protein SOVF_084620 [Spinacia oleracea]|nr:hypothetical protein SOVF_084620 [Spinacia oleracea]